MVNAVQTLREVLRDVDDVKVAQEAAIHIQWAIDLLNEANKLHELGRTTF